MVADSRTANVTETPPTGWFAAFVHEYDQRIVRQAPNAR